ncbi:hypothetical protein BKA70DRAFT_1051955, partial [Coprinopsis sp. MPI-PUGE-AT-0042]
MCATSLLVEHVGERFSALKQDNNKVYFRKVLKATAQGPFYSKYVQLPLISAPVTNIILSSPRLFPFFKDVLGAIDETHINCCPLAAERQAAHNHK